MDRFEMYKYKTETEKEDILRADAKAIQYMINPSLILCYTAITRNCRVFKFIDEVMLNECLKLVKDNNIALPRNIYKYINLKSTSLNKESLDYISLFVNQEQKNVIYLNNNYKQWSQVETTDSISI